MNSSRLAAAAAIVMACGLVSTAGALSRSPALLTDNGGRIIGSVESVGLTTADALVKVNNHFGHLLVYRNGRMQGEFTQVYFTTINCTGTGYVSFGGSDLPIRDFLVVTKTHPNHRLFYALAGTASSNVGTAGSVQAYDSDTCSASSQALTTVIALTEDTTAAGELNALAQPFHVNADDTGQAVFTPVSPCRLVDTRTGNGGIFNAGNSRTFTVVGNCGVPGYQGGAPFVKAVLVNIAVISPAGNGNLKAYRGDISPPSTSNINFTAGENIANNAIVQLAQDAVAGNDLGIQVNISSAHVVIDVYGYFTQ